MMLSFEIPATVAHRVITVIVGQYNIDQIVSKFLEMRLTRYTTCLLRTNAGLTRRNGAS